MKEITGTSMQDIEYKKRKKVKGKLCECKNCIYLEYGDSQNIKNKELNKKHIPLIYPYYCKIKKCGRYYTSKVVCNFF